MGSDSSRPVLLARSLFKTYGTRAAAHVAIAGVDLELDGPGIYAVIGRSGSGKSTLLHLLAGLDRPTHGSVSFRGVDITQLSERGLTALRREHFGFVFQRFHLLPTLSGRDNITLPTTLAGGTVNRQHVERICSALQLDQRTLQRRPDQMSGGQQQRVAVARSLAHKPSIVFADEPTGNLDSESSAATVSLLRQIVDEFRARVVLVTHDRSVADAADTVFVLQDGRLHDSQELSHLDSDRTRQLRESDAAAYVPKAIGLHHG